MARNGRGTVTSLLYIELSLATLARSGVPPSVGGRLTARPPLTAWHDVDCREIRYGIEARCHYKDVREGYLAEKADLKRAKERERRKKKGGADDE